VITLSVAFTAVSYKKCELMLMGRATAYSCSCSQCSKNIKKIIKKPYFGGSMSFKVISSPVFLMISSMSVHICNLCSC